MIMLLSAQRTAALGAASAYKTVSKPATLLKSNKVVLDGRLDSFSAFVAKFKSGYVYEGEKWPDGLYLEVIPL